VLFRSGRTSLHDVYHPDTNELILSAGDEITDVFATEIQESGAEGVEIRSVLTCESKQGCCAKCYGRNLATGRMTEKGDAVGIIAAQSIGEPGTQLTLRTFHQGGAAGNIATESQVIAKFEGIIQFDSVKTVDHVNADGDKIKVVLSRSGETRIIEKGTEKVMIVNNIPYGSNLLVKEGQKVTKGELICKWDPFNAVIVTEYAGKVKFDGIIEGITFREETDEQTGFKEKVIIETRDKTKIPTVIINTKGQDPKIYNIPVGAHIAVSDGEEIRSGQIIVKIPRSGGKTKHITGGLPRVTELFEARNPSNPAVVTEVDGVVTMGGIKRGNREVSIETKDGEVRKYLVPLTKHILVNDGDFIRACEPLSDGSITPADILAIKGPYAVQSYIVNEIQEVYRLQGVKINDKHIEVIVRQMMRKVIIEDSGHTTFLEGEAVDRLEFIEENDKLIELKMLLDSGDSKNYKPGMLLHVRKVMDENSALKRADKKLMNYEDAVPATSTPLLLGITRASLGTTSWISAASFQETTKVLSQASIAGKTDLMRGLKENVIVGHLIPAGTGLREYDDLVVGSQEEYDRLMATKKDVYVEAVEEE
jgi:DNA-directed RNA polymerase subunit beta'